MEALKTESVRDLESLDKILTSEEAVSMPSDAGEEPKLNNLSEEVDSIKRAEVKEESGATMRANSESEDEGMKIVEPTKRQDSGYVHREHETVIVKKQTWPTNTSRAIDNELDNCIQKL